MILYNPQNRFKEIYSIYQESFPEIERRTENGQKEVMKNPFYRIRVKEENGVIAAFLGYWMLPSCIFLEHLATSEHCRGKGYGKLLVEECLKEAALPVFLEIEPIIEEDPITEKRARFYERLGFYANSFFYEQKPLKKGDAPIPLWIMSYGKPITREEFESYKKEIYEIVYGITVKEKS